MIESGNWYPGGVAKTHPDKTAVVMAGSGDALTFTELDASANRLARTFRDLGLGPQAHVVACLENRIEFPQIAWGAHYAELSYTFASTRLTPGELAYIVQDSGSKVVVLSDKVATGAADLRDELAALGEGDVRLLGVEELFELAGPQDPSPIPDAHEGADMLYSSGTTGRPKGVKRPFSGLPLGSSLSVGLLGQLLMGMSDESVYLSPAPMYHAAPLRWTQEAMALGATAVIMERFDPEALLAAVERYKVTHAQFVPTMFVRLLRLPDEVKARYDVSSLQGALHAAAPCPPDVKRGMIDWWGPIVYEYYAGTEGQGLCWCTSEEWLAHPGSVGKAIVGQVHIVSAETGEELPPGEEGLVYFGGGGQFEYHNDPEKTAKAYNEKGWSTLGDIGRLDEDGFLYLTDRQSNMIITGGVNVYPQETENLLAAHPAVLDVAVIGVPNDDFGEEVKAIVLPAEGYEPGPELADELIAYCRANLADVKCPRTVDFRDELPRTPTGKLLKRLLRDEYWAGHAGRI
ncbi:MAG TPA: acyl-CoA synthetase [Acidimicrobiales bacterium]